MLKIYKLGEEVLRQNCEEVKPEEINDELRTLIKEMFLTMDEANGVGLAAPQVGIAKRFFVAMADDDVERVFINPVITKTSSELSPAAPCAAGSARTMRFPRSGMAFSSIPRGCAPSSSA